MRGRRTGAMLCVLLGHALAVFMLMKLTRYPLAGRVDVTPSFVTTLIEVVDRDDREFLRNAPLDREPSSLTDRLTAPTLPAGAVDVAAGESAPAAPPGYVDWPKEGKDAVTRMLAREAEAERVAKRFAGPQGTWASLTKRQQSELSQFRWKPGIDGLERDERGNTIYRLPSGCALVNFVFFGCPIGKKPPAYGDLFKDMRLYFDEQRRPATNEGNGREPESMRPPKWSKPLGEDDP